MKKWRSFVVPAVSLCPLCVCRSGSVVEIQWKGSYMGISRVAPDTYFGKYYCLHSLVAQSGLVGGWKESDDDDGRGRIRKCITFYNEALNKICCLESSVLPQHSLAAG